MIYHYFLFLIQTLRNMNFPLRAALATREVLVCGASAINQFQVILNSHWLVNYSDVSFEACKILIIRW